MARLILKYETTVIQEIPLKKAVASIGRTPGNDVVIDNLAVSSEHARVSFEYGEFVLEDLNSRNGTFVNKQRIQRKALRGGDEILIGKHTLIFQEEGGPPPEKLKAAEEGSQPMAKMEETFVLDTKKHRELLQEATKAAAGAAPPPGKVATLVVLSGKTDQKQYVLTAKLTLIGKSSMASVKLKGWFKPDVAAVVMSKGEVSYQVAPSGKVRVKLNGQVISGPQDLHHGDLIAVAGVEFGYRE